MDPLFFYLLAVAPSQLCTYVHSGFAIGVTVLRSGNDLLYLINMGLQFRLAYVQRGSLRLGNGELVTDPKKVAVHYAQLRGGLLLDLLVILPCPQVRLREGLGYSRVCEDHAGGLQSEGSNVGVERRARSGLISAVP